MRCPSFLSAAKYADYLRPHNLSHFAFRLKMTTQSTSGQADNLPDYDSIQPRRAVIKGIQTLAAPEPRGGSVGGTVPVSISVIYPLLAVPGIQSERDNLRCSPDSDYASWVYFTENMGAHLTEDSEALYKPLLPFAPPRTTIVVPRIGNKSNKREIQMEVTEVE
ncbi:hypothetical protein PCH_Pc22g13570 [Penicillium rubens Wisconsin 54-1255]|uniref:Uncharacterized protein n=1 Tax=Penicillium rubens (strain ATCC 28089 / DSM 1075 / NRRL 1951 / Wisconsin 54-1255) TaxID=500485 RepID=B6HTL0_PENRW|nr:hypothetical protein PCH_Pc22g13570 [Penicillium rubens Wisconsin 54-1255]